MNQIDTAPDELPRLVVEYEVPGIDEGVHAIAFDSRHLVVASGARLVRLVPATGRVIDQLETFPRAGGLAFDGRHLWQHIDGFFEQVEVRTGLAVRSVAVDLDDVTGLECFEGDLLVLHAGGRLLARVELVEHAEGVEAFVVADVPTDAPLRGLAWSRGELWTSAPGELLSIDPVSARAFARLALPPGMRVCDLAGDADSRLWCVDGDSRRVFALARPDASEWPLPVRPIRQTADNYLPSGTVPVAAENPAAVAAATFARILVPIDFDDTSRRALATALLLQDGLGSEVHLFHLVQHGANDEFLAGTGGAALPPGELVEAARAHLLRYVEDQFPGRADDVEVHAHFGTDVVSGIERAVSEVGATLVVLTGAPRQSIFRTHIEKIARDLHGGVMVLRTEEEEHASSHPRP